MDQAVAEHPIPLLPVPNVIGVELQGVDIQFPRKTKDADGGGDQYENQRYHWIDE
jgi:hypothetical protein